MKVNYIKQRIIIGLAAAVVFAGASLPVKADQFDDQINALQQQVNQQKATAAQFQAQAQDYQQQVNQLQAQINVVLANINLTDAKLAKLRVDIATAEAQLAQEKVVLGESIKQMYLSSGQSPFEVLVGSNSLSDYFNKQEYQDKVKDKVQKAMAAVVATKAQLEKDQQTANQDLINEQGQKQDLAAKQAQVASLLATAQQSVAAANQQVQANNSQISSLRAQQAAAMAARFGGAPGSGPACGGGYPGKWCNIPQDSVADSWGMYNRECVSYAAWAMTAKYGHFVPYGMGNANQWPAAARAAGIPTDSSPSVGSVAIWYVGQYGHAMVVDAVSGGNVIVSQYNYGMNGTYSTMSVPANGFTYIHFR